MALEDMVSIYSTSQGSMEPAGSNNNSSATDVSKIQIGANNLESSTPINESIFGQNNLTSPSELSSISIEMGRVFFFDGYLKICTELYLFRKHVLIRFTHRS